MNVTIAHQNGYILANVSGSIDHLTADDFRNAARPLVDEGSADIFLDLSETEYINSDGLGQLIELHKLAKHCSKRVVLISLTPFVRSVLATTNLDAVLNVADNVDDAIALAHDVVRN